MPSLHDAGHALTGRRLKLGCARQSQTSLLGAANDRRRQWVFAAAFQTGRQTQHFRLVKAVRRLNAQQSRSAFR